MPKRKLLDEVRKVLRIKNYELLHGEIPHPLDSQVCSLPRIFGCILGANRVQQESSFVPICPS